MARKNKYNPNEPSRPLYWLLINASLSPEFQKATKKYSIKFHDGREVIVFRVLPPRGKYRDWCKYMADILENEEKGMSQPGDDEHHEAEADCVKCDERVELEIKCKMATMDQAFVYAVETLNMIRLAKKEAVNLKYVVAWGCKEEGCDGKMFELLNDCFSLEGLIETFQFLVSDLGMVNRHRMMIDPLRGEDEVPNGEDTHDMNDDDEDSDDDGTVTDKTESDTPVARTPYKVTVPTTPDFFSDITFCRKALSVFEWLRSDADIKKIVPDYNAPTHISHLEAGLFAHAYRKHKKATMNVTKRKTWTNERIEAAMALPPYVHKLDPSGDAFPPKPEKTEKEMEEERDRKLGLARDQLKLTGWGGVVKNHSTGEPDHEADPAEGTDSSSSDGSEW